MHVVILPGLDGTGKMLTEFVEGMGTQHSIQPITYPADLILSYPELTQFVFKTLPEDKPYVILAESFSGPIAVKLAAQDPKGLRAIIFAASFVQKPNALPRFFGKFAKFFPLTTSLSYKLASPITFGKWATEKQESNLESAIKSVSKNVLADRIKSIMAVDELASFRKLKLPMLYLQPTQDRLVSKSSVNHMRKHNENMCLQEIEGSHFILQTNATSCSKAISAFVNSRL